MFLAILMFLGTSLPNQPSHCLISHLTAYKKGIGACVFLLLLLATLLFTQKLLNLLLLVTIQCA